MKKYWLDIEGAIQVDVEHDQFLEEFYQWLNSKGWTFGGGTKPAEEKIESETLQVNQLQLELQGVSNIDFLLYYDTDKKLGFEAQFDNKEFNGVISFCDHIGDDEEEWNPLTDQAIYEMVKERAIADYNVK